MALVKLEYQRHRLVEQDVRHRNQRVVPSCQNDQLLPQYIVLATLVPSGTANFIVIADFSIAIIIIVGYAIAMVII